MIDLYAAGSPNVQKVFLMLEETALPYNVIPIDIWKGAQFQPDFMKINPNAKVPAIVDHDGPGRRAYTVFESGAILLYLAEKTGRFLPRDTAAKFDAIQWMMIQMTGIGPISGQVVHFTRYAPPGNDYAASRYGTELKRLYGVLEQRLAKVAYLSGAEYGIADIATFPWARTMENLGAKRADHPSVARWVDAIAARPAVKAYLDKVAQLKSSRDTAQPDDMDRLFGRGKYARA